MITRLDQVKGHDGIYEVRRLPRPELTLEGALIGVIRVAGEAVLARPSARGGIEVLCRDMAEAQQVIVKSAQRHRLGA